MKLLDAYINGFGKFHNRSVTFHDGLNIIYGKNEAGKSTLHTFIRGMLFGIERGRGRASKNDLYSKYEPWEDKGMFEGRLRLEFEGTVYRIERNFHTKKKEFVIINENTGLEIVPTRAIMNQLLCGLSETAYNNTISISQLKCATDEGMVSELRNYIANLNTSGNMALNITNATSFLKKQRKELEAQMVPEAAREFTTMVGEIKNIEREISTPEYENQIITYQNLKSEAQNSLTEKQAEKENLLQKIARGRQILTNGQFTDQESITTYLEEAQKVYDEYLEDEEACNKKSKSVISYGFIVLATLLLGGAGVFGYMSLTNAQQRTYPVNPLLACSVLIGACLLFYGIGITIFFRQKNKLKDLNQNAKILQETFARHIGDSSISEGAMTAFRARMEEFSRLNTAVIKSEEAVLQLVVEINSLQEKQNNCSKVLEQQQRTQWELEKKIERLADCKSKAEALRLVLEENDRLRDELSAVDLALETMTELSTAFRDSFGIYLNKAASSLICGITGGIYNSLSVDENLNIFLNTKTKLVPLDQVSSGTMDQVYLALRLATARLMQEGDDIMPLIFDDSFSLYDDERLKTALMWLPEAYNGQILIFTCHQREAQMMDSNNVPYHLITI